MTRPRRAPSRRALGVLPVLLMLTACTSSRPAPEPQTPGERLLAEIGAALDADPTNPEHERTEHPGCPASYDRVSSSAAYDGQRVSVTREAGSCPDGDDGYFACHGIPEREGHPVALRNCFTRTLDDGVVLVAGRLVVYQESESFLVEVRGPGVRCVVGTAVGSGIPLALLARVGAEIRCE